MTRVAAYTPHNTVPNILVKIMTRVAAYTLNKNCAKYLSQHNDQSGCVNTKSNYFANLKTSVYLYVSCHFKISE